MNRRISTRYVVAILAVFTVVVVAAKTVRQPLSNPDAAALESYRSATTVSDLDSLEDLVVIESALARYGDPDALEQAVHHGTIARELNSLEDLVAVESAVRRFGDPDAAELAAYHGQKPAK